MVSLRSGGGSSVRPAPNLYEARGRQDRRGVGRVRSRGDGSAQHPAVSGLAAAERALESNLECDRGWVFGADRNVRRRGNNRVLPAVPKGRAAVSSTNGAGGRGGADGDRGHSFL